MMPNTVRDFMADAVLTAANSLTTAFLRIPEDKRDWSPDGKARTALDQYAECALLNGYTAQTLETRQIAAGSMENFLPEKDKLKTQEWELIHTLLESNAAKVAAAIQAVSDDEMTAEISTPWRPMTVAQIMAYPQWNMTYHEGQISYIASMFGCLE